jgi:hypothetical protein
VRRHKPESAEKVSGTFSAHCRPSAAVSIATDRSGTKTGAIESCAASASRGKKVPDTFSLPPRDAVLAAVARHALAPLPSPIYESTPPVTPSQKPPASPDPVQTAKDVEELLTGIENPAARASGFTELDRFLQRVKPKSDDVRGLKKVSGTFCAVRPRTVGRDGHCGGWPAVRGKGS